MEFRQNTANVLCVDIGATRVKFSILEQPASIESITAAKIYVQRTLGWLNHSLPEILSMSHPASIMRRSPDCFSSVAIAMPGPVNKGQFLRHRLRVPVEIQDEFQKMLPIGCSVEIVNDAQAWMKGFIAYDALKKLSTDYPCMTLILGTGVGLTVAFSPTDILPIELSKMPNEFKNLEKILGRKIDASEDIHGIMGRDFFEWVYFHRRHVWSFHDLSNEYTNRVSALTKDIQSILSYEIRTCFLGGGNADYIQANTNNFGVPKVIVLSNFSSNINSDIIPLMGLLSVLLAKQ